jgi:hypothetical protein
MLTTMVFESEAVVWPGTLSVVISWNRRIAALMTVWFPSGSSRAPWEERNIAMASMCFRMTAMCFSDKKWSTALVTNTARSSGIHRWSFSRTHTCSGISIAHSEPQEGSRSSSGDGSVPPACGAPTPLNSRWFLCIASEFSFAEAMAAEYSPR